MITIPTYGMKFSTQKLCMIILNLIFIGMAGCNNSTTSPSDNNTSITGTWRSLDTTTLIGTNDTDTVVETTFVTITDTLVFQANGSLTTIEYFNYSPKSSAVPDTDYRYTGTWSISGDTLIRDIDPISPESTFKNTYILSATNLRLLSIIQGKLDSEIYTRI
jgi:hypothetical protein